MLGQRALIAFAAQVPAPEPVRDDVEGRGGSHARMIAARRPPPIRGSPQPRRGLTALFRSRAAPAGATGADELRPPLDA